MKSRRGLSFAGGLILASLLASTGCAQESGADERIIVSGASGNLGGLTVDALLERGVPADSLILVSRTPERLAEYARMGASTRYGDFTEPESLAAAYDGGTRMLLISIGGGNLPEPRPELHRNAIDAAVAAGVEHIAYTSWAAISQGDVGGISADHVATEEMLRDSGVAWTMLRNSVYMDGIPQQVSEMLAAESVVVPPEDVAMSYITRADLAEASAVVLATTGHENVVYDLTGSELLGTREIAEAAMAVTGRALEIVDGEPGGAPGFAIPSLSFTTNDFSTLTGREPTTLHELLEANREMLIQ